MLQRSRGRWLLAVLASCTAHESGSAVPTGEAIASNASTEDIEPADAPPAAPIPLSVGATSLCPPNDWKECELRCDAGNALSCARLGHLLANGAILVRDKNTRETLDADPAKARDAYRRACDGGYARACNLLAVMLSDGKGGAADPAQASKQMAVACDRGVAEACANLGIVAQEAHQSRRAKRFFKKACELGDGESCLDAAEDSRGTIASFRHALKGAPVASAIAAAVVSCPEGTTATMIATSGGGLGGPETFCALPDGKRNGPSIEWASHEDLAEGSAHGAMRERGSYAKDRKDGPFTAWHANGKLRSKGAYVSGLEDGEWELFDDAGAPTEKGPFEAGKRDGTWTAWGNHDRTQTDYVAGMKHGKRITFLHGEKFSEESYVQGKQEGTTTRTWANGQKCVEAYVAGLRDGTMTCWHPNRRKMSESIWRAGQKVSGRDWDERGKLEK